MAPSAPGCVEDQDHFFVLFCRLGVSIAQDSFSRLRSSLCNTAEKPTQNESATIRNVFMGKMINY